MEKYDIVLYKTRKVWSNPCLPLYLRNGIIESSLENGDYKMELIKRSKLEEKWSVQKKFSNEFIILTLNRKKADGKGNGLMLTLKEKRG